MTSAKRKESNPISGLGRP